MSSFQGSSMVFKGDLKAVLMAGHDTDGLYNQSQPLHLPLIPYHFTDTYSSSFAHSQLSSLLNFFHFSSMPTFPTSSTNVVTPSYVETVGSHLSAFSKRVGLTDLWAKAGSMMGQAESSGESRQPPQALLYGSSPGSYRDRPQTIDPAATRILQKER
jgi:hypothetical protein